MRTTPDTTSTTPTITTPKPKSGPVAKAVGALALAVAGSVGACCTNPCEVASDMSEYVCCDTGEQSDGGAGGDGNDVEEWNEFARNVELGTYAYNPPLLSVNCTVPDFDADKGPLLVRIVAGVLDNNTQQMKTVIGTNAIKIYEGGQITIPDTINGSIVNYTVSITTANGEEVARPNPESAQL